MNTQPQDPYRTPEATLIDTSAPTLYKLPAVGIATFFGTPIAGAFILAHNLKALGMGERVASVWVIGIALVIASLILALILPENVPALPFTIAQLALMQFYARSLIGSKMEDIVLDQERPLYSNWRAFGISLLFMLAVLGALVMVVMVLPIEML